MKAEHEQTGMGGRWKGDDRIGGEEGARRVRLKGRWGRS